MKNRERDLQFNQVKTIFVVCIYAMDLTYILYIQFGNFAVHTPTMYLTKKDDSEARVKYVCICPDHETLRMRSIFKS